MSMELKELILRADVPPGKEESLRAALLPEYRPFLREDAPLLPFGIRLREGPPGGEVYFGGGGEIFFYLLKENRSRLHLGCIAREEADLSAFGAFCRKVREVLNLEENGLEESLCRDAGFEEIREMTVEAVLTEDERKAARTLADFPLRAALRGLSEASPEASNAEVEKLETIGLAGRETRVSCRKTGQLITAFRGSLPGGGFKGFQCSACGRPVSEEKIVKTLAPTPLGHRMTAPHRWLLLRLLEELEGCGIPSSAIRLREENFPVLFVRAAGRLFLFGAREDGFQLPDTFILSTMQKFFRPDAIVLVTASPLSKKVSYALSRMGAGENEVRVLPASALSEEVQEILRRAKEEEASGLLGCFEPFTRLSLSPLLAEYLLGAAPPPPEAPAASESESEAESEELIPMEVIPFEEIVLEKVSPGEAALSLAAQVAHGIRTEGLSGRWEEVEDHLRRIREHEFVSAGLSDFQGLLLLHEMSPERHPELMGALSTEIVRNVQRSLDEFGWSAFNILTLVGDGGVLHLMEARDAVLFLLDERPRPEETGRISSGEPSLREAVFKKVLEELQELPGVMGNLIVTRDGLPVECLLQEEVPIDLLSALGSQILTDSEKYVNRVGLSPLKQMLLKLPESTLSLIPLEREGLLISLLSPDVSREIEAQRLPAAAGVLATMFE